MFRLAHISDVHLGPLPQFKQRQLFSKRITGFINWKLNRKGAMQEDVLDQLIEHLKKSNPNHIAITGDLVNLALTEEITRMRKWLEALGTGEDISVIAGNHDSYVRSSFQNILEAWAPYMRGDDAEVSFPYIRNRDDVALIGLNSGVATLPFMATGLFDQAQAEKTEKLLSEAEKRGQFRVVMIHHPPFENATSWVKRLKGDGLFRDMISRCGAELVLHGHTHIDSFEFIDGPHGDVPVIGVPSASKAPPQIGDEPHHKKPGARYNLFEIERTKNAWNCSMKEFGFAESASEISLIAERKIYTNGKVVAG